MSVVENAGPESVQDNGATAAAPTALQLLMDRLAADEGTPGWEQEDAAARDTLVAAGWFSPNGSLTVPGARLRAALGTPALLRWEWTGAQGRTDTYVLAGEHVALMCDPGSANGAVVRFETMPAAALAIDLARRVGLGSVDRFADASAEASEDDDFEYVLADAGSAHRRIQDADEPVPLDEPGLAELWSRPWVAWRLVRVDPGRGDAVSTAGAGACAGLRIGGQDVVLRVGRDGSAVLGSRPAGLLWGSFVGAVAALPGGRRPVDPDDAPEW